MSDYILNIGPHHPSTHGVLRFILRMSGEIIDECRADIGYLHRSVEKLAEEQKWIQIIPFLDRLDYLAVATTEHVYAMAVEKLCDIVPTRRSLFIRVIFDELNRIASHIMAIGCQTHELGMLSVFLYSIEEREKIMKIFEIATGARMHFSYIVPGGVFHDICHEAIDLIKIFISNINEYLIKIEKMALNNKIFQKRTIGVGVIKESDIAEWALTGPIARASGIIKDIRKDKLYAIYDEINFNIVTDNNGDCYARMLVRYNEIKQSCTIIDQCIKMMPDGEPNALKEINAISHKKDGAMYSYFWFRGIQAKQNSKSSAMVDGPRGNLGVWLETESEPSMPYRMHVRSPSFTHIQYLQKLLTGVTIQDAIAIAGSFDVSVSDCDR